MTVSRSRGMVTSTLRRLCSRAPRTINASSAITRVNSLPDRGETSHGSRALDYPDAAREMRLSRSPFHRLATPSSDMPHTDAIVIMTTLASAEEAVKLVQTLLERRLIACG